MTIFLATDHAGFKLKEKIKKFLLGAGYQVRDFGAFSFDPEDDYPDFVRLAAKAVANDLEHSRGIIFGGSGQGEAMVANRFPRIRAAVYYGGSSKIITLSREHNDANVLSLGARFLKEKQALQAVRLWLKTGFSRKGRHKRRILKIDR